jgi:hypothetical protein
MEDRYFLADLITVLSSFGGFFVNLSEFMRANDWAFLIWLAICIAVAFWKLNWVAGIIAMPFDMVYLNPQLEGDDMVMSALCAFVIGSFIFTKYFLILAGGFILGIFANKDPK